MSNKDKLFQIADSQQGYFTSQQAEKSGFSRSNFNLKVKSGEWLKSLRGIYRLANYPVTDRSELVLWSLWSRGKNGQPQGVWSHETALDIHEISDLMPSKMHLSVPPGFRKSTPIPPHLKLHTATLKDSDVEVRQGYRITKPLRTLMDVIEEGKVSDDQVILAMKEALDRGILTMNEAQSLSLWTKTISKPDMEKALNIALSEVWENGKNSLADYGRVIESYTVVMALGRKERKTDKLLEGQGTGTLIEYNSNFYILTACHIARRIATSDSIRLLLMFDSHRRDYPYFEPSAFKVIEWDQSFDPKTLKGLENILQHLPKDLALIALSPYILSVLKEWKSFYKVSLPSELSETNAFVAMGATGRQISENPSTSHFDCGPYGLVCSEYRKFEEVDYVVCTVNSFGPNVFGEEDIPDFQGLSGAGLWKCCRGLKVELIGVTIAQEINIRSQVHIDKVFSHGPKSIRAMLEKINSP
ncbi:MAG: hypothetical protein Q8K75_12510 [Chlamydiales bacterium]|nr:hypothetical protein [Chlamydiales bacterium]